MILDSANLQCDGCGATKNHHIMVYPAGWGRWGRTDYCPDCTQNPGQHGGGQHGGGQHGGGMRLPEEGTNLMDVVRTN